MNEQQQGLELEKNYEKSSGVRLYMENGQIGLSKERLPNKGYDTPICTIRKAQVQEILDNPGNFKRIKNQEVKNKVDSLKYHYEGCGQDIEKRTILQLRDDIYER